MYDGSTKMVQDIVVGDKVMGDDSTPRNVIDLGRGEDELYEIIPKKGEKFGVNSEHILCLKQSGLNRIRSITNKNDTISYKVEYLNNLTTQELKDIMKSNQMRVTNNGSYYNKKEMVGKIYNFYK